jgi:ABC-type lipoprotein release transport system permease subunit
MMKKHPKLLHVFSELGHVLKNFIPGLKSMVIFMCLFFLYLNDRICVMLINRKLMPGFMRKILYKVSAVLNVLAVKVDDAPSKFQGRMQRFEIFDLSFKNMSSRKTRSLVTVGGMAIGVGAIVFLVSIGYGLQKLVIDKVARLDELRQADVSIQPGSNIYLDDDALASFQELDTVHSVLPLIGVAAKINFQGSKSDVAVYGEFLDPVRFTVFPRQWVEVRKEPTPHSELLGYTRQVEGVQNGHEVLGSAYFSVDKGECVKDAQDTWLGKWVSAKVYLWEKVECSDEFGCEEQNYLPKKDENGYSVQQQGYLDENILSVLSGGFVPPEKTIAGAPVLNEPAVLGLQSADGGVSLVLGDETSLTALADLGVDEEDLDWLDSILAISATEETSQTKTVALHPRAQREAVVNAAMLKMLGLERQDALGQQIDVSFAVTSDLLATGGEKLESEYAIYTIVGVVPEDSTPFFYAPIDDLRSLGISRYSQVKVVTTDESALPSIREKIEAFGYVTSSVTDTVTQINKLFGTSRIVLGFVGSIALGVAAFGMFNTLTVSLLERTREVGLMKAMGMPSEEVKRLFLTESLLMGFLGGVAGIIFGFLAGKSVSLVLSILGMSKGIGTLDVSYLPLSFVLLVFSLSLVVGIGTGIYPSKRATKISALDALRYE